MRAGKTLNQRRRGTALHTVREPHTTGLWLVSLHLHLHLGAARSHTT